MITVKTLFRSLVCAILAISWPLHGAVAAASALPLELEQAITHHHETIAKANSQLFTSYETAIANAHENGDQEALQTLKQRYYDHRVRCARLSLDPHAWLRTVIDGGLLDKNGTPVDTDYLSDRKFVLIYFSASWCGPCKLFSSSLIESLPAIERAGGAVILACQDDTRDAMLRYLKDSGMPWPGISKDHIAGAKIRSHFQSFITPSLIGLDSQGNIIYGDPGQAAQSVLKNILDQIRIDEDDTNNKLSL